MQLSVITRGSSTEKGKPKIYISCYERDGRASIDKISAWIHEVRNYVIYYPIEWEDINQGEHEENLYQMQCVVIPVFAKQKNWNEISIRDYHYANYNNIPVITILMDAADTPDFYKEYEKIYGNVQMLTPYDEDATKIPFIKQLEQYLEKIISSDIESYRVYQAEGVFCNDVKEDILSEFRGNIFISYRKKNRKHANALINILHDEKELWDVLLWYDEFLTPGEDYSETLQKNLLTCDFVLLLVTPDLFEKGNYVLTHEYPLAKSSGKIIIAVEAESVDEKFLKSVYPYIDLYIRKQDVNSLPKILAEYFRYTKGKQKAVDEKRAFILGKAYFHGLWVETNRERGIQLIQQAAEADYVPAMKWMANIYRVGNGVKVSPDKELLWLNRLALLLETVKGEKYADLSIEDDLITACDRIGDMYLLKGEFTKALNAYETMYMYARKLCNSRGIFLLKDAFASFEIIACQKIANACLYLNKLDDARQKLDDAIEIYKRISNSNISLGGSSVIAAVWSVYGKLEYKKNNYHKAIECFEKVLNYIGNGSSVSFAAEAEYQLRCEALEFLGIIHKDYGDKNQSYEYLQSSLQCAEQYKDEYPSLNALKCLMRPCYAIGKLFTECGMSKNAIAFYYRGVKYAEKIVQKESSSASIGDLARYLVSLAKSFYQIKKYNEAYECLKEAKRLIEKETAVVIDLRDCVELYTLLGNIQYMKKLYVGARECYKRALHYLKIQYSEDADEQVLMNLGSVYYKLATANTYITDWTSIDEATTVYKKLLTEYPHNNPKIAELYNNMIQMRSNRLERKEMNRSKIRKWSDYVWSVAKEFDNYGICCSNKTRFSDRLTVDILEMVIALLDDSADNLERASIILTHYIGIVISADELREYIFAKHTMLEKGSSEILSAIPESIAVAVSVMKKMAKMDDYHEGYPYMIRIVLLTIGEWLLDLSKDTKEKIELLIDYIDKIDLYLETELSDS